MFKVGDKVARRSAPEIPATVLSDNGMNPLGQQELFIQYDIAWMRSEHVTSEQLVPYPQLPTSQWGPRCTCGSDSVPGLGGHHSIWCDKYQNNP